MGVRIAKIRHEAILNMLRNRALEAVHSGNTGVVCLLYCRVQVCRVKGGVASRKHEHMAPHHCYLPPFCRGGVWGKCARLLATRIIQVARRLLGCLHRQYGWRGRALLYCWAGYS
jgi:hypothetical protein